MDQENLGLPEVTPPMVKKDIQIFETIAGLKNFKCMTVVVDGRPNGEYHLRPTKPGMHAYTLISMLNGVIEDSKFENVDPDGLLKIEYPVCMKVESILANEIIEDSLKQVDGFLS